MADTAEQLLAAVKALHSPDAPAQHRRAAEDYLLAFRSTELSWPFCMHVLAQPEAVDVDLQLYAAQTLRHKLNSQGVLLTNEQLLQLRNQLLQTLGSIGSGGLHGTRTSLLAQQLCLSLCTLVALLQQWTDAIECVHARLPASTCATFLRLLAEEAASDLRHIVIAGKTTEQLDWCSETRERIRSWAPQAAALLLQWMQQHEGTSAVQLLSCLGAWVRLGALHVVHHDIAVQLLQVVLHALQGSDDEACEAMSVLLEAPDYAPQRLLQELAPSMQSGMAAGACQAALAGDIGRAHSWCRVYAAYAAAQPEVLLAPDGRGQALREPLVQLCAIPHVWEDEPAALPAIEAWAALVDTEWAGSSTGSRNVDDDADDDVAGTQLLRSPELAGSCQQLQHSLLNTWLAWRQADCLNDPLAATHVRRSICDALTLSCQAVGLSTFMAAAVHLAGLQLPASGHQPNASGGSPLGRHDSAEMESVSLWQQQLLLAGEAWRLQAHAALRAQGALLMATCAGECQRRPMTRSSDDAGGDQLREAPQQRQRQCQEDAACGRLALQLLVHAAQLLQQMGTQPAPPLVASAAVDAEGLLLSFCEATSAWARHALAACSSQNEARALLAGLLQLLLGAASQEFCVLAAARGTKALLQAALGLGLGPLHELTPTLLQAVQSVESVAAEQEMIVALSASLASHWQCKEVLEARLHATKQLLEPLYALLTNVNGQLQQGSEWPAIASWADPQLAHHLGRLRVLLDIKLMSSGAACDDCAGAAGDLAPAVSGSEVAGSGVTGVATGHKSNGLAQAPQQQQEKPLLEQVQQLRSALQPSAQPQQQQQQQQRQLQDAASAGLQQVLHLLLGELWPLLHALCMRGASGRFLHALAKCCTAVLRVGGAAAMPAPVLAQFLQLASVCFERPGGPAMGELLETAMELASATGGGALHDSGSIMQALVHVWQQPGVLALQQQAGAGDQRPDVAEHFLKLATAFARSGLLPQPSSLAISLLDGALCAAALCAGCCHRKVASSALTFTCAVLGAAAGDGTQQLALQQLVERRGGAVVAGLVRALLAPTPLPRVHKVTSALLELAGLLQQKGRQRQQQQQTTAAVDSDGADVTTFGSDQQPLLAVWLAAAVDGLPQSAVPARDAHAMVAEWAALLTQSPRTDAKAGPRQYTASRSYVVSRRLKKQVREFAEHSGHQQSVGCSKDRLYSRAE